MKVQIGNFLKDTEIKIIFTYLELLEVSMAKFWKFALYTTLVPRVSKQTGVEDMDLEIVKNPLPVNDHSSPTWAIDIELHSA